MNVNTYTVFILGFVLLLAALVWQFTTQDTTPSEQAAASGRDSHGCRVAEDYSFSETIGACVQQADLTPDIEAAARQAVEYAGEEYALTVASFNAYEEPGVYDIILERGEAQHKETIYIRNNLVVPEQIVEKEDIIRVAAPLPGATISTPVQVSGVARGTWFFEGSFPLIVTDWDGLIIGEGYATTQDEWMTEDFVPFSGEVSFSLPTDTPHKRGVLIFKKDNPSDMRELDDALELPIMFE